ncbi:hypothetical protein MH206_13285 [Bacillus altitudinis]|uniref:hypothetical protein n=2 Tax=Bacillus TaxID=1386 RepID=UPI0022800BC1|nr:hypothetical protein [Bacillus altitudinis]MCY7630010.1 hypothetical protein [Bacillus altitudinis]MDX2365302.1 hypothetical protein [Bacillus altitudinis]
MNISLDRELQRGKDESFDDYFIRLHTNKHDYKIDKFVIRDLLNEESGENYSESKWRKDFAQNRRWADFHVNKNLDQEIADKYGETKIEAAKAEVRRRDQNREFAKKIRNSARFDRIREDMTEEIMDLEKKRPLTFSPPPSSTSDKHGLALFSDWHFGMDIDNRINTFNEHVFNERVQKLTQDVINYGKSKGISTLHVANLGDLIGGLIHVSTRVQANTDSIAQTQYVTETLAEVLAKFASEFEQVKFYSVAGNHGRLSPSKNDIGIKENFEYLITWYL